MGPTNDPKESTGINHQPTVDPLKSIEVSMQIVIRPTTDLSILRRSENSRSSDRIQISVSPSKGSRLTPDRD